MVRSVVVVRAEKESGVMKRVRGANAQIERKKRVLGDYKECCDSVDSMMQRALGGICMGKR